MQFRLLSPQIDLIIVICTSNLFIFLFWSFITTGHILISQFLFHRAQSLHSCTVAWQSLQFLLHRAQSPRYLSNSFSILHGRLAISSPSCTVALPVSLQFVFPRARSLINLRNSFSIVHSHFAISVIPSPFCMVASQSLQFHLHRAPSLCNLCNSLSIVLAPFATLFLVLFSSRNFNFGLFPLHIPIYS